MYIAKMHTKYPEFHGTEYYNFIISDDPDELDEKIEYVSHDFSLEGVVKTRHQSIEAVIAEYPTKQELNAKFFERG